MKTLIRIGYWNNGTVWFLVKGERLGPDEVPFCSEASGIHLGDFCFGRTETSSGRLKFSS